MKEYKIVTVVSPPTIYHPVVSFIVKDLDGNCWHVHCDANYIIDDYNHGFMARYEIAAKINEETGNSAVISAAGMQKLYDCVNKMENIIVRACVLPEEEKLINIDDMQVNI